VKYDLVVRGGLVVDPSQGLHGVADVAIADGKIAGVGEGLDAAGAGTVVDAAGRRGSW